MKHKIVVSVLAGAMIIPGSTVWVKADEVEDINQKDFLQTVGIERLSDKYDLLHSTRIYPVRTETGEYVNRAFSNVSDFAYVWKTPKNTEDWIGKIYKDTAVNILAFEGEWAKIQSGSVEGYIPVQFLFMGEDAKIRDKAYQKKEATVCADVLNVRSGRGTDTAIVGQMLENTVCKVRGNSVEGWVPVEFDGMFGWVAEEYVIKDTSYSYAEPKEKENDIYIEDTKLIEESFGERQSGTEEEEESGETQFGTEEGECKGTQIEIEERVFDQISLGIEEEKSGELQSEDEIFDAGLTDGKQTKRKSAEVSTVPVTGEDIIDFACRFIGNPYVWGGTSLTDGADCSGFVQSVYAHFGINLPRTTWDMESIGMEVSYEEALPGDLVLYDGHVGLYMGDGTIVNAMNEQDGIGICEATYAPIITVRRII